MLEQWVPFAAVSFIVLLSFITNVAFDPKVTDWTNSAPIEVNSPWKRPRVLAGKSLVVLWFATAFLYIATLLGAIAVDGVALQISSLPALLLLAGLTVAVITYKRSLAQQPNGALDERERGVRDTLYLTSYRIVGSILAGIFLAGFIAKFIAELEVNLDQIPTDTALGIVVTAAVFLWVLPSLVHAWTDPIPDEVSEEASYAWKTAKREIKREIAEIRKDLPKSEKVALAELRKADRKLGRTRTKKKTGKRS
jgi:predicted RND superfamily exporter protein